MREKESECKEEERRGGRGEELGREEGQVTVIRRSGKLREEGDNRKGPRGGRKGGREDEKEGNSVMESD